MSKPRKSRPGKVNKTESWYRVQNKSNGVAEVEIFDEIGFWGTTAASFVRDIKALGKVGTINLHLNTPGGSIIDGNAIYNVLKMHEATVNVSIEGVALSMGSVIAMSGDSITMAENGLFMIHNPQGGAYGEAKDLRKTAEIMDKMKDTLIKSYMNKVDFDEEALQSMMDEETWFTAEEALEAGFIDSITEHVELEAAFDVSQFSNVPPTYLTKAAPKAPNVDLNASVRSAIASIVAQNGIGKPLKTPTDPIDPNEEDMTKEELAAAEAKARKEGVAQALKAEDERKEAIKQSYSLHMEAHSELYVSCITDMNITPKEASDKLLEALGKASTPASKDPRIDAGEDAREKYLNASEEVMVERANGTRKTFDNDFSSFSLMDHARYALRIANVSTRGMSKMQIVGAAFTHSTSDFPNLLANVLGKQLMGAYSNFEETWSRIAIAGNVPDFKQNTRIRLGSFNSLETIEPGGEYKHGTFGEEQETITAATKGKMISFNRQAVINDDLGGFMRIAAMMGRAAARTVGTDVWNIITSNPNMSDGGALFSSGHANLLGTGTAITTTSLGLARSAMRKQQDVNSNDYLDINPAILAVPVTLEDLAKQTVSSTSDPANSNPNVINPIRGFAEVVSDPRLDASSATAWYLFADPQMNPTVEVAFLDGNQTPYLESQNGWNIDGVEWKVRLDYGVAPIDFRTAYKNPGA